MKNFITFYKLDLGQIQHTQLFIVVFNTVQPEDSCRRLLTHVGVVNKQRIQLQVHLLVSS